MRLEEPLQPPSFLEKPSSGDERARGPIRRENKQKEGAYMVLSFYKFFTLTVEECRSLQQSLEQVAKERKLCGLFLLSEEGINATLAGEHHAMAQFQRVLCQHVKGLYFKESTCHFLPFRRLKFQLRPEIVSTEEGMSNSQVIEENAQTYLSPQEWHAALGKGEGVFLDVRNWYETEIGTFRGAQTLDLEKFRDFGSVASVHINEKPVYLFCTGGIRCEKAAQEVRKHTQQPVYQLEGGILNYLKSYPEGYWEGECFVFDHRVAVDSHLRPSQKYGLCPHCGQPASEWSQCARCKADTRICVRCCKKGQVTCSKDCAYHHRISQEV